MEFFRIELIALVGLIGFTSCSSIKPLNSSGISSSNSESQESELDRLPDESASGQAGTSPLSVEDTSGDGDHEGLSNHSVNVRLVSFDETWYGLIEILDHPKLALAEISSFSGRGRAALLAALYAKYGSVTKVEWVLFKALGSHYTKQSLKNQSLDKQKNKLYDVIDSEFSNHEKISFHYKFIYTVGLNLSDYLKAEFDREPAVHYQVEDECIKHTEQLMFSDSKLNKSLCVLAEVESKERLNGSLLERSSGNRIQYIPISKKFMQENTIINLRALMKAKIKSIEI